MSHIPYALFPRIGFKTRRGLLNTAVVMGGLFLAITVPRYYFFPVLVLYTSWGLVKAVLLGLLDRLPDRDPLLDEEEAADESGAEVRRVDYRDLAPGRFRRIRRRRSDVQGPNEKEPENPDDPL
jgi:hypothetical protein